MRLYRMSSVSFYWKADHALTEKKSEKWLLLFPESGESENKCDTNERIKQKNTQEIVII